MKHSKLKRTLSLLITTALFVGSLPASVFATENSNETSTQTVETVLQEENTTDKDSFQVNEEVTEADNENNDVVTDGIIEETSDTTVDQNNNETTEVIADETTKESSEKIAEAVTEETTNDIIEESENNAVTFLADNGGMTYVSSKVTPLAPGVEETKYTVLDSNGDQVVYYAVTADIATSDSVLVKANYHDNDNTGNWGKATIVEQANAAKEKRGYNVVATTNASYYNVSTGQPTGAFVMEGVNINGNSMGDNYPFFAIMNDGTAMIGEKGTFSTYADQIQEAVGGHNLLVWNGKAIEGLNTTSKYPRSTVGITEDGDVILMLADGNNKPYSAGLTYAEQAALMVDLGCVAAVELDGGGSATYAAKPEGSDEIEVRNVCCDGTVRSVANSIMVISTAVADGTFDHVNLSTDYAYYVPNSIIDINVVGADAAGGVAEIPDDITWILSDESFGSVSDGVVTLKNEKTGTVTVKALYNDEVVGEMDIMIVNPTSIAFSADAKTVPYGGSSDFTVTALYNSAEVYAAAEAFDFNVTAGTMDGFVYKAPDDTDITNATITATYKYTDLTATVAVSFGQGSKILFDFENADVSDWTTYNGMVEAANNGKYTNGYSDIYGDVGNGIDDGIQENVFLATKENGGQVYNGDYSLGYTLDYTQSTSHANWQYDYLYYLGDILTYRDVDNGINGTRLGMWMYIPEEAVGLCARLAYTYETTSGTLNTGYLYFTYQYVTKGFSKLTSEKIPEAGWAYVYCDLDDISKTYATSAYYKTEDGTLTREASSNYAPAFIQFIVSSSATGAEKCTVYIDDITLDYSDVVDDRDAPIISNSLALDDQNSYVLDGSTLNFNTVSFTADVSEDTSHGMNFTGLNTSTAQIYVDGQKVHTNYSAGKIATTEIMLPNGTHDITFEIADNQGNYTKQTKQVVIDADTEYPVVFLDGEALGVNSEGNLYTGAQYNLVLKTDKVEAIDTITTKIWLNSASSWALEHMTSLYGFETSYSLDELACTATVTITRIEDTGMTGAATLVTIPVYAWSWDGTAGHDATTQWNSNGCAPQITVSYKVKYGEIKYTKEYVVNSANYISGFSNTRQDVQTELNSSIANLKVTIGEWHYHTEGEACNADADCITGGYTNRVFCTVCNSVLDWGTTIKHTGHDYQVVDNQLVCTCGDTVTGTGLYQVGEKVYYLISDELVSGWVVDSDTQNYYYFDSDDYSAYTGVQTIDDAEYTFDDNGVMVRGAFVETEKGTRYLCGGNPIVKKWITLEEGTYWLDLNGYVAYGDFPVIESLGGTYCWYHFNEETGLLEYTCDGYIEYNNETYYCENGAVFYGAIGVGDDIIFCATLGKVIKNSKCFVSGDTKNCELSDGLYYCNADGKIISDGFVTIDDSEYYFKDYQRALGFTKIEEKYYFFNASSGKMYKNITLWVSGNNAYGIASGYYEFQEDGTMYIPDPNGPKAIIEEDENLYFTIDNVKQRNGLNELDGEYYYAQTNGILARNEVVWVSQTNDLVSSKGYYAFDCDGKMIKTGFVYAPNGNTYYYTNAVLSKGFTKVGEAYYFFNASSGKMYINTTLWVGGNNTYGITAGYYEFQEDGRMYIPDPNGPKAIVEEDGNLYFTIDGIKQKNGLNELDGEYYYAKTSGILAKNETVWVSQINGLVGSTGYYAFDDDGKMVKTGFVITSDDNIYYYDNTILAKGFTKIGENYYFFNTSSGKMYKSTVLWISSNNAYDIEAGYYEFSADGTMVME